METAFLSPWGCVGLVRTPPPYNSPPPPIRPRRRRASQRALRVSGAAAASAGASKQQAARSGWLYFHYVLGVARSTQHAPAVCVLVSFRLHSH
jgi:hypothetical protein